MSDAVLSVSEFGSLQQLRITVQQAPSDTTKDHYTTQVILPHRDWICLHGPPTLHTHTAAVLPGSLQTLSKEQHESISNTH
eukprot:364098-Chlamydomonas_euryale.AAC.4